LLGQLHDAGEAYIGDLPRPVEVEFEAVEQPEARNRRAVWTAVNLEPPDESE
jgi:5'-deoxynucleotidase YfbR-like HD superfamily hydrolase